MRMQILRGMAKVLGVDLDTVGARVIETTPRAVIRAARHDYLKRDDWVGEYALKLLNGGPIGAQGYARDALMNLKERDDYITYSAQNDNWWRYTRAACRYLDAADAAVAEWLSEGA